MFWFFGTLGSHFLSLIFGFWKVQNCILNQNLHFWGGSVLWNFLIWGFLDDFIQSSGIIFLVPFLATKKTLAPLANDPIMSGTSIRSFRHLENLNPSINSEFIDGPRCGQIFSSNFGHQGDIGAPCRWSYNLEKIDMVF